MTGMRAVAEAAVQVLSAQVAAYRDDPAAEMAAMWRTTGEQGWHLLAVPETAGGMGGDLADLAAVVRAVSAAGLSAPLPELHAGLFGMLAAGLDPAAALDGRIGVALPRGAEIAVPWGRHLDAAVLAGTTLPCADLRPAVNLAHEPVDTLAGAAAGTTPDPVVNRWRILHAARLVGAAEGAARRTAAYAATREQFGRPIARFQAVAALVAEAHAQAVLAAAALDAALVAADDDPVTVPAGLATAARAAGVVARCAHQVHGAIGVTRELGLERLTRRLWAWRDLPTEHELEAGIGRAVRAGGEPLAWSAGPEFDVGSSG
ncbi:acyl-CoA dehydrogenase family protein [Polymorphospora rubra]|uniref:Acyl-CoA dehydrogenase n=2 Tax=Polymorphospora rubra TaxID=338584 RepID=A0A810N1X9_9ACTN|nr:acyl-CoA dehydrogenase [Polymorphospora rubra]